MPRPSARLDLLVVPATEDAPEVCRSLMARWVEAGHVDANGRPGSSPEMLVPGGFVRLRIDDPKRWTLYANQQGGFRVTCPLCGGNLVRELGEGVHRLATDPAASVLCPSCSESSRIDALVYAPIAAVGRAALVLADVGHSQLTDAARADIAEQIGAFHVVARRVHTR